MPVCVEISPVKGYCVHTISEKEFYVDHNEKLNGKTWWEMRPAMVFVPPQSWAELKAYVIKVCKKFKECAKDIGSWERKTQQIDSKMSK